MLFPSGKERNIAFAVFGTVAGAGAAVGMVLGGFLTEFFDWRWCLLVNLFFVAVGLLGGALFLTESKAEGDKRYDLWGTLFVTGGLAALVYGFTLAENGWGNPLTIGFLALGAVLLVVFVWVETRVRNPLLPLRVVTHRVRAGAFLIQAVAGSVMIGATLYLTSTCRSCSAGARWRRVSPAFRCHWAPWRSRRWRPRCWGRSDRVRC